METNPVRKANPEETNRIRAFQEAVKREAERIKSIRGTPKCSFKYKIEARLTVSKTIEVEAESLEHAENLINDEIDRGLHFVVDDDESPWGCEDWKLKLLETVDLPPPPKMVNPSEPELPL